MKQRKHVYFYVGQSRPTYELSRDDWGVKRLYLHDDIFKARAQRDVLNQPPMRKNGDRLHRIYRVRFVEVF